MTKIFTEDGKEYEIDEKTFVWFSTNPYGGFIKPIEPIEKKTYKIFMEHKLGSRWLGEYKLTEPQAEAISEAIKALMEYIQSQVDGGKTTTEKHNTFIELTKAAGKAHKLAGKAKVPRSQRLARKLMENE